MKNMVMLRCLRVFWWFLETFTRGYNFFVPGTPSISALGQRLQAAVVQKFKGSAPDGLMSEDGDLSWLGKMDGKFAAKPQKCEISMGLGHPNYPNSSHLHPVASCKAHIEPWLFRICPMGQTRSLILPCRLGHILVVVVVVVVVVGCWLLVVGCCLLFVVTCHLLFVICSLFFVAVDYDDQRLSEGKCCCEAYKQQAHTKYCVCFISLFMWTAEFMAQQVYAPVLFRSLDSESPGGPKSWTSLTSCNQGHASRFDRWKSSKVIESHWFFFF